jgi:hypothetical protein
MMAQEITDRFKVDFLCIGAQRSGTSWLTRNLRRLPDVYIPPSKELHYFSRSNSYHSPSFLACNTIFAKLLGSSPEAKAWRRFVAERPTHWIGRAPLREKPSLILWSIRYLFGRPDDRWYLSLFRDGIGRIKGELTPAYSLLNDVDVAKISALFPDLKVLLLMRDPLDRVISQLFYHMDGQAGCVSLADASPEALVRFAVESGQIERGNYPRIIDAWERHFPSGNIMRIFYDDICAFPEKVLLQIFTFLGVDRAGMPDSETARERANSSSARQLDAGIIRRIAEIHEPVVRGCAHRLGGHALSWLERLERVKKVPVW